jgi:hypothetical protein
MLDALYARIASGIYAHSGDRLPAAMGLRLDPRQQQPEDLRGHARRPPTMDLWPSTMRALNPGG